MSTATSPHTGPATSQRWRRLVPLVFVTYSRADHWAVRPNESFRPPATPIE
jgi:hypothetical protein